MKDPNVQGIYHVVYRGWFGEGFGDFRLEAGRVTGLDAGGGAYDGEYQWNEHTCSVDVDTDLRFLLPNIMVQDGKLRHPGETTRIRISFPWHTLGQPFAVNLPVGPLMLTVTRTSEIQKAA
jgi:hypothetical protein